MSKYIDAVKAAEVISEEMGISIFDLIDVIVNIPTADVQEVEHGKWISVKGRLPDNDDRVLVVVTGNPKPNITLDRAYELGIYDSEHGWFIEAYEYWENPRVTHWMPLPESPEVSGDG